MRRRFLQLLAASLWNMLASWWSIGVVIKNAWAGVLVILALVARLLVSGCIDAEQIGQH
jgi:hypothetical protein